MNLGKEGADAQILNQAPKKKKHKGLWVQNLFLSRLWPFLVLRPQSLDRKASAPTPFGFLWWPGHASVSATKDKESKGVPRLRRGNQAVHRKEKKTA